MFYNAVVLIVKNKYVPPLRFQVNSDKKNHALILFVNVSHISQCLICQVEFWILSQITFKIVKIIPFCRSAEVIHGLKNFIL